MQTLKDLSVTDLIGLWGGFVATIVLVWDIAKWRLTGPRLLIRAQSNMRTINYPSFDGNALISVTVSNYGDRAVTLTNLGVVHYGTAIARITRRATKTAIVGTPSEVQRLPFLLEPGAEWTGLADQEQLLSEMGYSGTLFVVVSHSGKGASPGGDSRSSGADCPIVSAVGTQDPAGHR